MNCFVIMPFAAEFDDVYAMISTAVDSAIGSSAGHCFRLDESRPAGRITTRLIAELKAASICVADLSQTKPNVMWELGFAMALDKPTIIITQNSDALPFDIHDMQTIRYQRDRLHATLAGPLKQAVLDTLGQLSGNAGSSPPDASAVSLEAMLFEISQLKSIVAEVVASKSVAFKSDMGPMREQQTLAGNWLSIESGSHVYSRVVRGELVSPYCFDGNYELSAVYFGWRRIGEFWFARYQWLKEPYSGFTFLRMNSLDNMSGAWWDSDEEGSDDKRPSDKSGVASNWVRSDGPVPDWAEEFFQQVEQEGLASRLARLP